VRRLRIVAMAIGLLLGSAGAVRAEDATPPAPRAAPAGDERERDPFETSPLMAEKAGAEGGPRFVPGREGDPLPRISLRGFLQVAGKAPAALVEIEGIGVFLVRAGDTISVPVAGRSSVLRVERIDDLSVHVAVGSLGQLLVVR